jgi:hypothetical protein
MSTDFKALWNKEGSKVPDIQEIFAKANAMNRKTRRKIWRQNIVLSLTAIFIVWVWWYYQPQMISTKIGIVIIVIAIVMFLTVTNQVFNLLTDGNVETDSREYLAQIIRVKQKQEFLATTITKLYFILLITGLCLYMIEYTLRGSMTFRITFYGMTIAWIAFCWFYLVPKGIKKQQKAINEVIEKLEEVNGQLAE